MTCSKTQKHLRAYLDGELDVALQAAVSAHLRECASCQTEAAREREFDETLREMDDFYGEAPGLAVPPNFLRRVVEQAQAASRPIGVAATERKPLWSWFTEFGLPVRLAVVSALLLATFGGLRAGQVISDLITRSNEPRPPVITPDMTPAEQSLVMLMRSEGLVIAGKPLDKTQKMREGQQ